MQEALDELGDERDLPVAGTVWSDRSGKDDDKATGDGNGAPRRRSQRAPFPATEPGGDEAASAETADPDARRGPAAGDGARDGMPEVLGAPEVPVEEQWQGYGRMTVPEISDRLPAQGDEGLLAVRDYEVTHKNRRGVIEAVERELKRR
jgi:hypothetical protein